jgi:TldD protein
MAAALMLFLESAWRRIWSYAVKVMIPTLSQRARKDGAPSVILGKLGHPPPGAPSSSIDDHSLMQLNTFLLESKRVNCLHSSGSGVQFQPTLRICSEERSMSARKGLVLFLFLLLACHAVIAQSGPTDPVLNAMQRELARSMQNFQKAPVAPYFLSYQLTDNRAIGVFVSFGTLTSVSDQNTRVLDIDLRVGDYKLDNTHPLREQTASMPDIEDRLEAPRVPLDNDPMALRVALWQGTEQRYRRALERLQQVQANVQVKVEQEDRSGDFSHETPEHYSEPIANFSLDTQTWEQRLRNVTKPFAQRKEILSATAQLDGEIETRRYVNSDGSQIRISTPFYRIIISATAKADDGMELPLHQTYMSFHPEGLPDEATISKDVEKMISTLLLLTKAPLAEPYTGPAILSGRASAVFFHEIFGHRVEGQRQKNEDEAQTFKKKVNQSVLPDFLSVYSDPNLREIGHTEMLGFYPFDDEGVRAQRVTVVQNGILKAFLMSRTPISGFDHSNGHGRRQQGYAVVARQSNLVVESSKSVSREQLKKMLVEQIKSANKPYGLLFDDIEGGFTFTQRIIPNAFNVRPTVVYRIYPDGREELVRGVDLIGTPLTSFSKIVAADDDVAVFNGMCGAESGWVPVSAAAPGLLISQIEVQRKEKSQERAPLLAPPASSDSK